MRFAGSRQGWFTAEENNVLVRAITDIKSDIVWERQSSFLIALNCLLMLLIQILIFIYIYFLLIVVFFYCLVLRISLTIELFNLI